MKSIMLNRRIILWTLATACFSLLSVKWMFAPAVWIALALLIVLMRELTTWKSLLVGFSVLYTSSLTGSYKVMPFPLVVFLFIALVGSVQQLIPFFLYKLIYNKTRVWYHTLLFPCLYVAYEYFNGFGGGGTWGSLAYTQVNNSSLMQLSSITGLWGITFIIAWGAALLAEWHSHEFRFTHIRRQAYIFIILILTLQVLGTVRIKSILQKEIPTVRVAGIIGQNLEMLQSTYAAVFGKRLDVDLQELTQTSPELQELNRGLLKFIENPSDTIFKSTHLQMEEFQDSILNLVRKEAISGAKIIVLSEALLFTTRATEDKLIDKARQLAKEQQFYFLLTVASIIPGKVTMGSKYLENKAIFIGPDGQILNEFFKNKPVPLVEPSIQGDGQIPVIDTPHGRIAISICYDADFPYLMRQAGQKEADIVLLPSGDWKEISPYHGYMAVVRGIENGFSLIRPGSGGLSIASDYLGIIRANNDFSSIGEHVVVSHLPTNGISTIYADLGDWFAWICLLVIFLVLLKFIWENLSK